MKLTVFASVESHSRNAYGWIYQKIDAPLVKVKYGKKSVVLSYRQIDRNFEQLYNREGRLNLILNQSIVLEQYYRNILGVTTQTEYDFIIEPAKGLLNNLRFLRNNVNDTTRITYWLAMFSLWISIIFSIAGLVAEFAH